ncbi:MAG: hypothetical protein ACK4OM_08365, partial [Alphaproteobacteria bacterium]
LESLLGPTTSRNSFMLRSFPARSMSSTMITKLAFAPDITAKQLCLTPMPSLPYGPNLCWQRI